MSTLQTEEDYISKRKKQASNLIKFFGNTQCFLVCDSMNMCKEREGFTRDFPQNFNAKFCPFCGKEWHDIAI